MRLLRFLITLILAAAGLVLIRPAVFARPTPRSASPSELIGKIHPALMKQLLSGHDDQLRVIIVMRDQPDLNAIIALDRSALVAALQATANRSQAGVLTALAQAQQLNRAGPVRPLWINDTIAARLDRSTLYTIAARDDVALVKLDQYRQWIAPLSVPNSEVHLPHSIEWNIAKIRADRVWAALNITGTGAVVANMDTGVDGLHPALQFSYRGYNPHGPPSQWGNWFDATDLPSQYPYDPHGHGTHTMGTLVGADGIGVAPGAKWIAARILDRDGYGLDSWIHAGFQWILAPGGDPQRAPDVVNNSWGNVLGTDQEFRGDVRLINAAGIIAVFSNGNGGPAAGTVGSPASLPEVFGIGATDRYDIIANFSSRGPSPFGPIKPDLSAPGVHVRSSFPGGTYLNADGTSMAAPHVAGVAALMRSAAPGLTITATRYALTSTAIRPTTGTYPNNVYGWGRLDAYGAVLAVAQTGVLSGVIARDDNGTPIANASVHAESIAGTFADMVTDADGQYQTAAAASIYTLTASAFGYAPQARTNVPVLTGTITRRDFALTPLPTGQAEGRVTDLTGVTFLSGTLRVSDSPLQINVSGTYLLELPIGTHVLEVRSIRHRIVTATITIKAGQKITQDFALPDAPSLLLVDSGQWYNGSEIMYYQQALADLGYLYTDWPIRDATVDRPTTPTLRSYDAVIWSSPFDSPGLIGAAEAISDYLSAGGQLVLSGQDVGYFDGQWTYSAYYPERLLAQLVADDGPGRVLTGRRSFAGQVITIAGAGGADNQRNPDVIASLQPLFTEPAFDYAPGQSGGHTIGLCRPYRAVYWAYGFEAITDRAARSDVMSRTLAFFARPPSVQRYVLQPPGDPLIGPPGTLVTGALDLYNFDEVMTTTFAIDVDSQWPVSITPTVATLAPCERRTLIMTATIPAGTPPGTIDAVTIHAAPMLIPEGVVTTTLKVKSPGSVLLVDDDRWYPVDPAYRAALEVNGIPYDMWRVPTAWSGLDPSTPSVERMQWYPEVIWFTGYDWYQPLTEQNEISLTQYLTGGGRLLLSSQEYLARRELNDFGRNVLGVLNDVDDLTATMASGAVGSVFDGIALQSLEFPYQNFSDALSPQSNVEVALIGQHGWPIALANTRGISKSMFMSFGFETLPAAIQAEAMNRLVGYLSWLGQSSAKFDRAAAATGDQVTLTIVARNDGAAPIDHAAFTATLPLSVTYAGGDALAWSGSLAPNQSVTHTIAVTIAADNSIAVPVEFDDSDHRLHFTATARLPINAPVFAFDLTVSPNPSRPREVVTWTLRARNLGVSVPSAVMVAQLPFDQRVISGSVTANSGAAAVHGGTIDWNGSIQANQAVTMTYQMTTPFALTKRLDYGSAFITDGADVWHAGQWLFSEPRRVYLPVLKK